MSAPREYRLVDVVVSENGELWVAPEFGLEAVTWAEMERLIDAVVETWPLWDPSTKRILEYGGVR